MTTVEPTPASVTSTPVYFGPEDCPLFGWVYQPADLRSRGTVIVCEPLAREYISAHYTFRILGETLAARGITVVRFDYDGTGDSGGDDAEPGRIDAALGSVAHAIDLARSLGTPRISLVGMRLGALLAALAAASDDSVSDLVLWDPCSSGREFLRAQSALFRMLYGKSHPEHGGTEVPGFVLSASTVEELSALAAPAALPAVAHTLILDRPDRPASGTFGLDEERCTRVEAVGQAELMDVEPFLSTVPTAAIDCIADWLDDRYPTERSAQARPAARDTIAVQSHGGSRVTERIVSLGPLDLFGILATGESNSVGPPVLFLNSGKDPHTGPNRMWVELSRKWAALGFPCYRFDLSGLGDSPVRPGQAPDRVRVSEAFDDVIDVVAAVVGRSSDGDVTPVVLAGLCAGAYQILESAIDLHPLSVLSVNPILRFQPPESGAGGPMDPRRRLCKPAGSLRSAYRSLPSWKILRVTRDRYLALAGKYSRQRSPLEWLEETAAHGTDILCICGEAEAAPFFEGAPEDRTTLDEEHCRLEVIEGLDHGLMLAEHRAKVTALLTGRLSSLFLQDARAGAHHASTQPSSPLLSNS